MRIPRAAGACVLVTGAGGFIGAEMVRVFASSGAERILLLDVCEQHLFETAAEISACGGGPRCVPVLGSVCDRALLEALFEEHRPELVLHAAALKHAPLMESNPIAAVATNALGTWIVAEAAERHGAGHMLLVSTDKAAAPCSIMGAAKRIAELAMLVPGRTRRAALRLVNVIGSPGSVGPLFAAQIARGAPVTVTHPDARRWFLTLDETARLLAEAMLETGLLLPNLKLLLRGRNEPIRIAELAQRMIAAGGRDVPVVFTAPRPGEKLDEVLLAADEQAGSPATRHLCRVISPDRDHLDVHLARLESAVAARDLPRLLNLVADLVPGYEPSAVLRESAAALAPIQR